MKYLSFEIQNYRAIEKSITIDFRKSSLIPIVGINECGKTTILQAIYCFDDTNDEEYNGNHLNDTKNLYKTSDEHPPFITATLNLKWKELNEEYKDFLESESLKSFAQQITGEISEEERIKWESQINRLSETIPFQKNDFKDEIKITRNLHTKKYFIDSWPSDNYYTAEFHNSFAIKLLINLPYILYNDDFIDRPPTSIKIPNDNKSSISGWLAIYERLFKTTSADYSIFKIIKETDTRRREGIISDVQARLNKTLSKAWKTFLLSSHGSLDVKLNLLANTDPEDSASHSYVLDIKIVERIKNNERLFHISDRSKGFLWFFNFVMKLEFNPKIAGDLKNTIYLLDEPGSYLHYTAQEKLCHKLVDISHEHGIVIYCTHSHTLLNPDLIPLNTIYIVEKDSKKRITATSLPNVKTNAEKNTAYQPILEALQISALTFESTKNKIVAVEGIYDKYSIELFCNLKDISILPGTSADSIKKNIQFLIGFNKNYCAIWDNDHEGDEHYKKAIKFFGVEESMKFDKLPLLNLMSRRMEEMYEDNDLDIIKNELELDVSSSYERIISSLYFSKKEKRKAVIQKVSAGTKNNFHILNEIIIKRFKEAKELESLRD